MKTRKIIVLFAIITTFFLTGKTFAYHNATYNNGITNFESNLYDDSQYQKEITSLFNKLKKDVDLLNSNIKKALNGDLNAKKQSIELGAEIKTIFLFLDKYKSVISEEQKMQFKRQLDNITPIDDNLLNSLKEVNLNNLVNENLDKIAKLTDQTIPLAKKILNGDLSVKEKLTGILFENYKTLSILEENKIVMLTPEQIERRDLIEKKLSDAISNTEFKEIEKALFPIQPQTNDFENTVSVTEADPLQTETSDIDPSKADKFLDKYEEFIDKSIPLLYGIQKQDTEAIQEYVQMVQEFQPFIEKMGECLTNLDEEQIKRYTAMTEKYTKALQQFSSSENNQDNNLAEVDEIEVDSFTVGEIDNLIDKMKNIYDIVPSTIEKAKKGDITAKRQLYKIGAELKTIQAFSSRYGDSMSSSQSSEMESYRQKIYEYDDNDGIDRLVDGVDASGLINESLSKIDNLINQGIPLGKKILNGDLSVKKKFLDILYDGIKAWNLLEITNLSPTQQTREEALTKKINDVFSEEEQQNILNAVFPSQIKSYNEEEIETVIETETPEVE